jgi:glycosyltransferase involved in cell wall biosynthesis
MTVGMFTSTEERCGIAAYSRDLIGALAREVDVQTSAASFEPVPPSAYRAVAERLNEADLVHVQHSYAFFGGMGPRRTGSRVLLGAIRRPLAVTVHELDLRATGAHRLPPAAEIAYKRAFNRRTLILPNVGVWIVHAEPLREGLIGLGAPAARIECLPMPVPNVPGTLPEGARAKQRWGVEGRTVLTIFGFLARRKGYDVALAALRNLPPDFILLAAGGTHGADTTRPEVWLRAEAERLQVADRLRITGYLAEDEVALAMAASDVVLAPFTEMSASASLHQALAFGRPVIASDLPANRDLGCVALAPVGDATALARVIREITGDPVQRAALQDRAVRYVADHSYETLARATLHLYDRIRDHAHRH